MNTNTNIRKLQSQGVHHITLVGADRQTSIDFWEGVLGMPFVFEQPNLDKPSESHLYFDPGDGRLITNSIKTETHSSVGFWPNHNPDASPATVPGDEPARELPEGCEDFPAPDKF